MPDDIRIPELRPMAGQRAPISSSYRARRVGRGFEVSPLRAGAVAAGVLVLALGGWGVFGRHSAVVPVIEADSSPIRVRPDNPGGMQVAGADELSDSNGGETMAPPAEAPAPQALRAQMQQAAPAGAPPAAAGAAGAVPGDAPAGAPVGSASPAPALAPMAVPANVPPPKRGAVAGTMPPGAGSAAPVSGVTPGVVASGAGRVEAARPEAARPVPSAQAPAAAAAPAVSGGGTVVQLGALASEAAAQAEWQKLVKTIPELSGRTPIVQKTEHDGRTLWRLRTAGFADVADATAFCGRVRGKGGACTIASF